ncbi:MAG: RluA family pseudouridine synthase [Spirochaetia bacterium]
MNRKTIKVPIEADSEPRIDKFITEQENLFPRSQIKQRNARFILNGKEVKASKKVKPGDIVQVSWEELPEPEIEPEQVDLDIIYEDDNVLVINKQQGMVVHPANGNYSGTLAQGLLYYCRSIAESFSTEDMRPGIVHRLDKDTSGVIITAKNTETLEFLSQQFRSRKTMKTYYAVTKGIPKPKEGIIKGIIGRDRKNRKAFTWKTSSGKPAKTDYKVLNRFGTYAFVELHPRTGRTHQLRVHMRSVGTPILGDPIYARKDARFKNATLMLHAAKLEISIPGTDEPMVFRAPLPKRFSRFFRKIKNQPS